MMETVQPVGDLLRTWRRRRRMSQLELACDADISTRHLSFVETGRAQPSRDMVLHLAERLDVPLRERNLLLVAAGYAPVFPKRALADPALQAARKAIDLVLAGHEPYPAVAIDRHWNIVGYNRALLALLAGAKAELLTPPVNAMRLSLHPDGLAPRIANYAEWRGHLLARLRHQIDVTADAVLVKLMDELRGYKAPPSARSERPAPATDYAGVIVPLRMITDAGVLAFFNTTTIFGTPVDVTLAELALECFYPADAATAEALHRAAATRERDGRAEPAARLAAAPGQA